MLKVLGKGYGRVHLVRNAADGRLDTEPAQGFEYFGVEFGHRLGFEDNGCRRPVAGTYVQPMVKEIEFDVVRTAGVRDR
jgi:hypothetical protein